jgi:hypothetical protein
MKYLKFRNTAVFAFFLMLFATPAFAQFEVNPDHFDDQPPAKTKANAASKKKTQAHVASTDGKAGGKGKAAGNVTAAGGSRVAKPHPGRKSAGTLAAANKRTSEAQKATSATASGTEPAPSLKAQASNVQRE